jgi:hypothetical protein
MGGVDNATEDAPRNALNNDKSCFGLDLPRAEGRPGLRLAFTISMGEPSSVTISGDHPNADIQTPKRSDTPDCVNVSNQKKVPEICSDLSQSSISADLIHSRVSAPLAPCTYAQLQGSKNAARTASEGMKITVQELPHAVFV